MLEAAVVGCQPDVRMEFDKPTLIERLFNRLFGLLVRIGIGLPHNVLLQVRGRKSGRIYSTPVNILTHNGRRYLVAPRGDTQWSRNARASGEATFVKGFKREHVKLREIVDADKPPLLKAYLESFTTTVQRYFPVRAGSRLEEFAPLAARYPVFEIQNH
jgi:deazaflavin-dependent oxidoreductase (nitroreductase family)